MEEQINIFWLEDEPEEIDKYVRELEQHDISVKIFTDSSEALDEIRDRVKPKEEEEDNDDGVKNFFDGGIADLQLIGEKDDGIKFTRSVISIYNENLQIFPRIGYVSAHENMYLKTDIESVPFTFKFRKANLEEKHTIRWFARQMRRQAYLFKADYAAVEYNRAHPSPLLSDDKLTLKSTIFGYVHSIHDEIMIVNVWDPHRIFSESSQHYEKKFLSRRGIENEGQFLRISTFEHVDKFDIITSIDRVGEMEPDKWVTLRKNYNYDRFRKILDE